MSGIRSSAVQITSRLQSNCYDAYLSVGNKFTVGISEEDIAQIIKSELAKQNVTEYWYDIPIIVLIGSNRFKDITVKDYVKKSPSRKIMLKAGDPLYIDIHPLDNSSKQWGDWNTMAVFHPRDHIDNEQINFLEEMYQIQRNGMAKIHAGLTGAEVYNYFMDIFDQKGIILCDVRNNVGHSMHTGQKGNAAISFLDTNNHEKLGEGIYAVEPSGYRQRKSSDGIVVGRFEDCIYLPARGKSIFLGNPKMLPVVI